MIKQFLKLIKKLPDLAVIDIKLDKGDRDGIDLLKVNYEKK